MNGRGKRGTAPLPPLAEPVRPIQRVGHVGYEDHRFCGAAVFGELTERIDQPFELMAVAFGLPPLDDDGREVLRALALCLTAPDARVWPLKLARVLASFGDPFAGCFGAQLASAGEHMGPGTATAAATSLGWMLGQLPAEPGAAEVRAVVAAHLAQRGRLAGFGVPLRKEDERLLGLHRLLSGHPAQQGRAWRLHLQVIEVMREREQLEPNIALPMAALLLDLGLSAERTGLFATMLMAHTFAAHAVEAAAQDGPLLRELGAEDLADESRPPRRSPRAQLASERRRPK